MDAINSVASTLNRSIDAVHDYLKENAIAIGVLQGVLLAAVVYYFRTQCKNIKLEIVFY